jgi:hypothetical protein
MVMWTGFSNYCCVSSVKSACSNRPYSLCILNLVIQNFFMTIVLSVKPHFMFLSINVVFIMIAKFVLSSKALKINNYNIIH